MISKTFFKSSLIYSVIGSLPYVSGVILIPFFIANLSTNQFGVNVIYFSMMALFQVFAGFSMESLIGVYYFEFKENKQRLRELIGMVLIISLFIGAALLVLSSIFGPAAYRMLWPKVDSLQFFPFGLFTLMTAIFNAGFKFYSAMLISQQRPVRFFTISILNFTLTIIFSLLLLYQFPYTLTGPILGRMIPAAFTFILSVILMNYEFGLSFNSDLIRPIMSFCIPVVVYSLLIWVVNNIDRFIIQHFFPDSTYVGVYDNAVKITLFIDLIQTGLANTINPKVFTIWKENNLKESTVEVNRYYNGFTALTLLIIPLIVISMPILIPIVIKKQVYYEALVFLPILTLGFATRGWFFMLTAPIYYFKRTRSLPRIFLFSALFQIACSIILIKYFGLIGAVWTNFLVKPVQAFFLFLESRKIFTFKVNKWKILYLPVIYIGFVIISEAFATNATRFYIEIGQFITSVILVWFAYRRELVPFLSKLIRK
jgi:O-antigen/teichoic acid export membrane protein